MDNTIISESSGNTIIITLNKPKTRNALSTDMVISLISELQKANADAQCRAIVLTGAGGNFCSGGDVSAMTADRPILASRIRIERAHQIIRLINGGPKPVIAAVDGIAYGLGLSLASACDYIVASKNSSFCAVFNKVGLIPDMGLMATLPLRVGLVKSKQFMFLAKPVNCEEALRIGLVDQTTECEDTLQTALTQATEFGSSAPLPIALTKAFYSKGSASLEEALRTEVDHQPALYLSEDHLEGVAAFREKRLPKFNGR